MSYAKTFVVKTSEQHSVNVLATSQRIENDINGNPKLFIQVWVLREDGTGNLWCPKINGYKLTKKDGYNMHPYHGNIEDDIKYFIIDFENAVYCQ